MFAGPFTSYVSTAGFFDPDFPPELREKDGLTSGHAMCRGYDPDTATLFHIGNWKPKTGYRDMRSLIIQTLDTALEWFDLDTAEKAEADAAEPAVTLGMSVDEEGQEPPDFSCFFKKRKFKQGS